MFKYFDVFQNKNIFKKKTHKEQMKIIEKKSLSSSRELSRRHETQKKTEQIRNDRICESSNVIELREGMVCGGAWLSEVDWSTTFDAVDRVPTSKAFLLNSSS